MKKMILLLSFSWTAMFFVTSGCDSDSDKDNNNLLGLLVLTSGAMPATEYSGSSEDVTPAGGAAASAINAFNQVGSMYSFTSPGFSVAPAEGTFLPKDIQESAMASLQGSINDRLMAISGDCDGTYQTMDDDITEADITTTLPVGMVITTATLNVTGTYKCTVEKTAESYYNKMNSSLHITGSMSVAYSESASALSVFDIAQYLSGGSFTFTAPTVEGNVDLADIDQSVASYLYINMNSTTVGPYKYGYYNWGTMNMSGSIALDSGSPFDFSLAVENKRKYDLKAESIYGEKPVGKFNYRLCYTCHKRHHWY